MKLKVIKIGNVVYSNVNTSDDGRDLIPADVYGLKKVVIDTLNWVIGKRILDTVGNFNKLVAANSKGIVLLAKILRNSGITPTGLTDKEKEALSGIYELADAGYADSELLNNTIHSLADLLKSMSSLLNKAETCSSREELLDILRSLE